MRVVGAVLAAALLREEAFLSRKPPSQLTGLLKQAKEQLTAREVSCKAELEKGDVQVEDARSIASQTSNLVTKAQSDLTKLQVELEVTDKQLYALKDGRPEAQAACAEDKALKKAQHEMVSSDADVTAAMVRGMDCAKGSLLVCGTRLRLSPALEALAAQLSPAAAKNQTALLQQAPPPVDAEAAPDPCVVAPAPRCANVADGIAQLHSLLRNSAGRIAAAREHTDEACRTGDAASVSKQQSLRSKRVNLVDRIQLGMSAYGVAQKTAERRNGEFLHLQNLVAEWRADCDRDLKDLQFKIEQLGRTRTKQEGLVSDCEVSGWQDGPCSAECGGGTRNVTRSVVMPPGEGGHSCPALARVEECNRLACPTDCAMSDWGPWAACSLTCGGGTQSRNRGVLRPAKGGMPCGATGATQLCNMQACDVDCVLSDWSVWGPCSQSCGGGAQTRTREPVEDAVGNGMCWAWDDPIRREYQPCPLTPCSPPAVVEPGAIVPVVDPTVGFESCPAKLDVVIVLDASGSVSPEQFQAEQRAAAAVLERMPNVNAGAVAFAGAARDLAPLGDAAKTARALSGAATAGLNPGGSDLAMGFGAARRMLLGRIGANERPAVVVLFTDRKDNAEDRRDTAARDLREAGVRVVAVLTGPSHSAAFAEVVTKPPYANLVTAASFAAIDPVAVARTLCPPAPKPPLPVPAAAVAPALR